MFRFVIVLSFALTVFGQLVEEAHPAPEPYSFAFSSPNDDGTSSSREETGDASGRVTGSYTIQGADGQSRRVEYVADENGFRANVITNEIGTESQNTADVQVQSSAPTAAELTAQWEASGAGRAQLAVPQQVLARPALGIARGVGLVSAPIAPIAGGFIGGQNLRLRQGFGLRGQAVGPIAAPRAVLSAPVAPIAQLAPAPVVARAPFQGFLQGFRAPLTSNLGVNQFGLGLAPLGHQNVHGLGLGLRGLNGLNLGGLHNGGNLLVAQGQSHLLQGASPALVAEREVVVNNEALGRKGY